MKNHYYKKDILEICDKKHLTVEQIFEEISNKFSDAGKSSIYRNVEDMVKKWDLRKVVWIWKKAYFEKEKGNHIHLIDTNSWSIIDVDQCVNFWNLPKDFKISDMDIKIFWEFINSK